MTFALRLAKNNPMRARRRGAPLAGRGLERGNWATRRPIPSACCHEQTSAQPRCSRGALNQTRGARPSSTGVAPFLSKALHDITRRCEGGGYPGVAARHGVFAGSNPLRRRPRSGCTEEPVDHKPQLSKCAIPILLTLTFRNALPPVNLSRWTACYRCASIVSMTGKRAKMKSLLKI
jgi:hypothetical protein